ncbi:MAG: hypothetical protein QW648_02345 [Nanoarchaeales archaeon]
MNLAKLLVILFFGILFLFISFSQFFPYPFYQQDSIQTLMEFSNSYYRNLFNINISNEIIIIPYTYDISGSPIFEIDSTATPTINSTDYPTPTIYIEAESENITKFGNWVFVIDTSFSNSTYIRSTNIGDYIEFICNCSVVSVWWRRDTNNGYIDVYVNDSLFMQIDTYGSASRQFSNIHIAQKEGIYKIRLQVSQDKNPNSRGNKVEIDLIKFGSGRYRPYIHSKLFLPDNEYITLRSGTATSNYLITYHYLGSSGWAVIYNLTFYVYVANPTSKTIRLGIAGHDEFYDYITGSGQTTSRKVYCYLEIPPNTNFTLYILNASSPNCALRTNSTHAGMQRTLYYPGPNSPTYTGWNTISFRIFANDTGLLLNNFFLGLDRNMPEFKIINARTGEDLTYGGYIDCDVLRNIGLNITISNLIPSSSGWRIRMLASSNLLDFALNTYSGSANSEGKLIVNNFRDTSGRICGDYDYANVIAIMLDNPTIGGVAGSSFNYLSAPIYTTPWNWKIPTINIYDLETGNEEYVLRAGKTYKIIANITFLNGTPISSGISVSFAFTAMYGTDGVKGYENPFLLDGTMPYILWSDRTFSLNYNSTSKLYERIIKMPNEFKYDGHISAVRLRITNNTNSTYRIRFSTWHIPQPFTFILFTNHYYSGKGIDVVFKDLDFGTSSGHIFYTASGGNPPSFNDNVNDVYIEDKERIILIYNSSELSAQTPITFCFKKNMFCHYTSGSFWSPGYTYLGTYRQKRYVYGESGLGKDYVALIFNEKNDLGYDYYVYFYTPANSDWFEIFVIYPEINSLDFLILLTGRIREYGNYRILNNTIRILESVYGRELSNYFFKPLTAIGLTQHIHLAPSANIAREIYLGYTTTIPMPTSNSLKAAFPFPLEFLYFDYHGYYNSEFSDRHKFIFILYFTEALTEYRLDSLTWTLFGYNTGHLANGNFRISRIRFITNIFNNNPYEAYETFLKNAYTFQYGYFTKLTGESIDIWFNKKERSYAVGEKIIANFLVRNYTIPISTQINIYILDQNNNLIYNNVLQSNSSGLASVQFSLQKEGVYRILAKSDEFFGIGFIWVRGIRQIISTDKEVYAPGERVKISNYVYDTATLSLVNANVYCDVLNPSNQIVLSFSLTKTKNEYSGGFILSQNANPGVWKIVCYADDGTTINKEERMFYVFEITKPEETISYLLLTAPSLIRNNSNISYYLTIYNRLNNLINCEEAIIYMFDENFQPLGSGNMYLLNDGFTYSFSWIPPQNLNYVIAYASCKYKNNYYQSNKVITQISSFLEESENIYISEEKTNEVMIIFGLIALIFVLLSIFSQDFLIKIYFVFASFLNIMLIFPSNLILGFFINSAIIIIFIIIYAILYLRDFLKEFKDMINYIKKKKY